MRPAAIRVGDHAPELNAAARQTNEAYAIVKVAPSVPEYLALADRFHDAASALCIAVNTKSFAGIRSAYLDLHEIAHQTGGMNDGLRHAIEAAGREYRR